MHSGATIILASGGIIASSQSAKREHRGQVVRGLVDRATVVPNIGWFRLGEIKGWCGWSPAGVVGCLEFSPRASPSGTTWCSARKVVSRGV